MSVRVPFFDPRSCFTPPCLLQGCRQQAMLKALAAHTPSQAGPLRSGHGAQALGKQQQQQQQQRNLWRTRAGSHAVEGAGLPHSLHEVLAMPRLTRQLLAALVQLELERKQVEVERKEVEVAALQREVQFQEVRFQLEQTKFQVGLSCVSSRRANRHAFRCAATVSTQAATSPSRCDLQTLLMEHMKLSGLLHMRGLLGEHLTSGARALALHCVPPCI